MHVFLNVFYKLFDKLFSYCNHFSAFMAMWSLLQTAHETFYHINVDKNIRNYQ